jgi:predicted AAA+ superfamily ATPase
LVDSSTVQVVVTGSSALRIEAERDSLAGRITSLEAGTLSLTEIATLRGLDLGEPYLKDNGLEALTQAAFWTGLREHGESLKPVRDVAFAAFSERGGYPLAHLRADAPWDQVADQLNETVIKRVIQHDLRLGERGRKRDPALLEELFRLCCRYAGQAPTIQALAREIQRVLQANVGTQRVNAYLRFLGETLLLRLIPPLEIRLKRKHGSPKLCLVDHGLRASWLQEQIPLAPAKLREEPELTTVAGHLAESVTGALLSTITGLDIAHFPERQGEPEVDFVLTIGVKRIPIEVKYQARIDSLRDTESLRSFIEKAVNNAPFGLLVTQDGSPGVVDPRIIELPLSSLMLLR